MSEGINEKVLAELGNMKDSIADIVNSITELDGKVEASLVNIQGKLKGNHELIQQDLKHCVTKETCSEYRERAGSRVGELEQELRLVKRDIDRHLRIHDNTSDKAKDAAISWIPSFLKTAGVIGGLLYAMSEGWIQI